MATISSLNSLTNFDSYFKTVTSKEQQSIDKLKTKKTSLNRKSAVLSDLKSKLNTLRTRLKGFTAYGSDARLSAKEADSSDESIFTAEADSTAVTATHTVNIERIAKNDFLVSDVVKGADTDYADSLGTSTQEFTVQVGSNDAVNISVTISEGDTNEDILENIASQINQNADDVSATVVSNTRTKVRLVITSDEAGSENAITVTDSGGSSLASEISISGGGRTDASSTKGGYITEDSDDLDAQLTVNGIEIISSDNTITGVIEGVTINLRKESSGDETITVTNNTEAIKEQIEGFITEYNDVLNYLNAKTGVDVVSNTRGDLSGDYGFINLKIGFRTQISEEVSGIESGKPSQIQAIGISINKGVLALDDEDELDAAIAADADAVINLFTATDIGIADKLIDTIESHTLTGKTIDRNVSLVNTQIKNISSRETGLTTRLNTRETVLKKKYAELEQTLALLSSQQSMLQRFGLSFTSFYQTGNTRNTGYNLFGF
ncbi:flagellar filament capping protein FliD [candidate division KSB1 bacterium]